jgi:hypothetical protein
MSSIEVRLASQEVSAAYPLFQVDEATTVNRRRFLQAALVLLAVGWTPIPTLACPRKRNRVHYMQIWKCGADAAARGECLGCGAPTIPGSWRCPECWPESWTDQMCDDWETRHDERGRSSD